METPKALTPEEIAAFQNSRALSDAELIKGGGGHDPEYGGSFAPTAAQKEAARVEMTKDRDAKYEQFKMENKRQAIEIKRQATEIENMKQQVQELRSKMNQAKELLSTEGEEAPRLPDGKDIDNIRIIDEDSFQSLYNSQGEYLSNDLTESGLILGEVPEDVLAASFKAAEIMRQGEKDIIFVKGKGYYAVEKIDLGTQPITTIGDQFKKR